MDDSLEQPNADISKTLISETGEPLTKDDDEGQSSGDEEDGGLDWTKLPQVLHFLHISAHAHLPQVDPLRLAPSFQNEARKNMNQSLPD